MSYSYTSVYFDDTPVPGRAVDFFAPESPWRDIAIFFVHGGGWEAGSRDSCHCLMRAFTKKGFFCGSTDYRLSGVTIWDQIADVRRGYHHFVEALGENSGARKVVIHGSSAGAHLGLMLAMVDPRQANPKYPDLWVAPAGVTVQSAPLTFVPWPDMFPHIWISMKKIVGQSYEQNPQAYKDVSPLELVGPATPPIFLLEAANEHMFPHEQTVQFIEKMKVFGRRVEHKIYENVEHGFFYSLDRTQQRQAFEDVLTFISSLEG